MVFPCTSCGLCCKYISNVPELKNFDIGNGVCKYLNKETNICDIYDSRPNICKVDKMFDIEFNKYLSKMEYYLENAKVCNALQKENNLNKNYKVIIGE